MGTGIIILVLTLLFGGLTTAGVLIMVKRLKKQISDATGTEGSDADDRIAILDTTIESAVLSITEMIPMDEIKAIESELAKLDADLKSEQEKLQKLESTLSGNQTQVDRQEAKHNELKQGKEECLRVADETRATKEQLMGEYQALRGQLEVSKEQMQVLATDTTLTGAQQKALAEVKKSLENYSAQYVNLGEAFEQASNRFLTLQAQYDELEKEYRKLVDKELSGTF